MNARLFSPATPHTGGGRASFASSSASAGGVLDDDDEASVGSKGKGKGGGGAPRADGVLDAGKHTHHGLKWLWPPERRDGEKRTLDDPMYNPRTLYVPPQFIQKETPAMRQWWEFKSKNFDTILFFKVRGLGLVGVGWPASRTRILNIHHTITLNTHRWASSTRSSTWTRTSPSRSSTSST